MFLYNYAGTFVVPLSVNVYMLAVIIFFNGVATGLLDGGKVQQLYTYIM